MPRALDPILQDGLENNKGSAIIRAHIVCADASTFTSNEVLYYKLSNFKLEIKLAPCEFVIAPGSAYIRIERGLKIGGVEYTVFSSWYIVRTLDITYYETTIQAHLFTINNISIAGDTAVNTVLDVFIALTDVAHHTNTISYLASAEWWKTIQFLPTGFALTLNKADFILNKMKQKYLVALFDIGDQKVMPIGASMLSEYPATPFDHILAYASVADFAYGIPTSSGRYFKWIDEADAIHYSGTPSRPLHNLGFIKSTVTPILTGFDVDSFYAILSPPRLDICNGDYCKITLPFDYTAAEMSSRVLVDEIFDPNTSAIGKHKNKFIWRMELRAVEWIANSEMADGTSTFIGNGSGLTDIDGGNIQTGTITNAELEALAITASKIANLTISAGKIALLTITGAQIANGTIAAEKIVANTITANEIAALTITSAKIAALTITGAKIKAGTITADKLIVATLSAISANMGSLTAGTITGGLIQTTASPAPRIEFAATLLAGYSDAVTKQFWLDAATGKAFAGGGVCQMDANGYTVIPADAWSDLRQYRIASADGSVIYAGFGGYITGSQVVSEIRHPANADLNSIHKINVKAPAELWASILLEATSGALNTVGITVMASAVFANSYISLNNARVKIPYGLDLGTATGAGPGQIVTSDSISIGSSFTGGRLKVTGTNYDFYVGAVHANTIGFGYDANAAIDGWINYSGYAGGVTQFRNFKVGDGKNASLLSIAGSTGIVTMDKYGAGTATFSAAGVISSVSDERYKIKDGVIKDPISMLTALEPGYFYLKPEANMGNDRQLGFYAQNVRKAIGPEAAPDPIGNRPWGYYERSVLAVVVEATKLLSAKVDTLAARI